MREPINKRVHVDVIGIQRQNKQTKKIYIFTQFESSSQSSDDRDRVGGVCAELVQWREESIPLVLQLGPRQETGSSKQMVKVPYDIQNVHFCTEGNTHIDAGCGRVELVFGQGW